MFSDLYAAALIGPAFAFALIDLLRLVGLLQDGNEITFNVLHPSPALRVQQVLEQLKADQWWDELGRIEMEHVHLIRSLAAMKQEPVILLPEPELIKASLLETFRSALPSIRAAANAVAAPARKTDAADKFAKHRSQIGECLANGIVPSAIVRPDLRPGPVAIINAAYVFLLTGLPELTKKLADADRKDPVKDRTKLRQKIEAWTMKAIEDFQVLGAI